jgi:putative ABC transport system permease protein
VGPGPIQVIITRPLAAPKRTAAGKLAWETGIDVASGTITHSRFEKRHGHPRLLVALSLNTATALDSIRGNWLRSFLTVLGVIIGVASVIVLVAFGQGAQKEITAQIDTLGANVAILVPGKMQGQSNFNPTGNLGISNLTDRDVAAVRGVAGVRSVAPLMFISGGVYRGDKPAGICMPIATVPEFLKIRRLALAKGRFLTDAEQDQPVCVLGTGIKKDLFGAEEALGKKITVNEQPYTVVGVVGERSIGSGLFGGEELDAIIYLPLKAVQRFTKTRQIHRVFIEVAPGADPEGVMQNARAVLLGLHKGRDDFSLLRSKELLKMFYKVFTMLAALLLGITSISLVVGGIGIMNVMLVTVTERTSEIGIRKTVGARRQDIFLQFLTEAVTLSAVGGLLGIGLAFVACAVAAHWLPLKPLITTGSILLGFTVCVVVGIIAGVVPAIAAARMDPIVAIRHE